MKRHIGTLTFVFLFGFAAPNFLHAQYGMSSARSLAMGGAYTALARGVQAPGWNPANLALPREKRFELNMLSIGVDFHNNSFTKKFYDLYNGRFLTAEDKRNILAAIPANGLTSTLDTEIQALGFSAGAFAFTVRGLAASEVQMSKDLAELVLFGNEIGRSYDIGDTDGEGWSAASVALSFAFPLQVRAFKKFTLGFSLKYLHGFAFAKVREATSKIQTDESAVYGSGKIVVDRSFGGNGFGLDLGAAAQLSENTFLSVGITNLANYIKWSTSSKRFTYSFQIDSLSVERADSRGLDSVFVDSEVTTDLNAFTVSLPSQLRIGLAHTTGRLSLALDVKQGLRSGPGVSSQPEVALGTEVKPIGFLPLRAGVSFGGNRGLSAGAGFALDFSVFSWSFAVASRGGMFNGRGVAAGFDWVFRF